MSDAPTDPLDDGLSGAPAQAPTPEQQAALDEAAAWVGGDVSAVGLGTTDDGEPAVVVYGGPGIPDLPEQVQGLPVRFIRSEPFQALDEPPDPPS